MYAIIEDERLVVEYPSLSVRGGEAPIERSTLEGFGFDIDDTCVDSVAVWTVASSGMRTETVDPDVSTLQLVEDVSSAWLVVPAEDVVW